MKYEIELTTNWRRGNKLFTNKYFTKIKIREKFEFQILKKYNQFFSYLTKISNVIAKDN